MILEKALSIERWSNCVLKADRSVPLPHDEDFSSQKAGHLVLPALQFKPKALGGMLTNHALGAHMQIHKKYVDKTRELVADTDLAEKPLLDVIKEVGKEDKNGSLFRNASQAWNHAFYWMSISPPGQDTSPKDELLDAVKAEYGDIDACREKMIDEAAKLFGSGWLWLVKIGDKPEIVLSKDAMSPLLQESMLPLLCIDLWEHAYFYDYYSDKGSYLNNAVNGLLNWRFADRNWNRQADDASA
jgi:Fe-Mn family superoxide dismutase